jgi:metallophosphoesterase superfamily enzyme
MDKLIGKTIVFTDQHFGVKGNSPLRQKIGALVIKKLLDAIDRRQISNVIFCGDYFH